MVSDYLCTADQKIELLWEREFGGTLSSGVNGVGYLPQ
jgi:hypothetical protein